MKRKALVFALMIALSAAGTQAFSDSDFDRLQQKADNGDPDAQLEIGRLYLTGRGVVADTDRGIAYLRSASDRGNAYAFTELAKYYEQFPKDPAAAAAAQRFYRRGAELGDTEAQTRLGRMFIEASVTNGFDPSYAKTLADQAVFLLRHAAMHGNRDAAWELGYALLQGRGVSKDEGEGLRWLVTAADAGHVAAAYAVAQYSLAEPGSPQYAPASGLRYLEKAANGGSLPATSDLVNVYLTGNPVVSPNLLKAEQWAQKAVALGVPGADDQLERVRGLRQAQIAAKQAEADRIAQQQRDAEARVQAAATLADKAPSLDTPTLQAVATALAAPAAEPALTPAPALVTKPAAAVKSDWAQAEAPVTPRLAADAAPPAARTPHSSTELSLQDDPASATGTQGLLQQVGILRGRVASLEAEVTSLKGQLSSRDAIIASLTAERDRALADAKQLRTQYDQVAAQLAKLKGEPGPLSTEEPVRVAAKNDQRAKGEQWNQQAMAALRDGDFKQARALFERASDAGVAAATNNLATLYMQGKSVPVDIDRAIALYQQAADQGHGMAANNLGYIYEHGMGVPRDLSRARQWYVRAAQLGVSIAQENLRNLPRNAPITVAALAP